MREPERIETVIVGGGQSGLAVGYHLARRERPFVILDANDQVGDSWQKRWDALRVFTPARLSPDWRDWGPPFLAGGTIGLIAWLLSGLFSPRMRRD